jgi:TonB-dependent receptor
LQKENAVLSKRARAYFGASTSLFIALAVPAYAAAEEVGSDAAAHYSISGYVYDETGAALPGARVALNGSGEATTDLQGAFTIIAPAESDAELIVDYLGRPTTTQVVRLEERGRPVRIIVGSTNSNGEIVVTAGAIIDSTARALNQQRQADNTVTILSADAIGRFPDPNIAEALQRVPGVAIERDQGEGRYINVRGGPAEFSSITIDGISIVSVDPATRAVNLDTIPSDIVANLEVTKSLVPSQDADSISGAVNISTRSAFDRTGFAMSGMTGGSYNQFGGKSDYRASGAVSNRFGPDGQFGIIMSGSYSMTNRQPENVENTWGLVGAPGAQRYGVTETLFKDYETKRERIAGTAALEWRPVDGHRFFLRGTYARFKDDEYRDQLGITWSDGTLQPGYTDTTATYTNTRLQKQVRHRIQQNEIWSVVAGGENRLGLGTLSYDVAYSRSDQTYPRRDELLWRSTLRPTQSYDFSGGGLPKYSLFDTKENLQTDSFRFYENAFRSNTTKNDELSARIRMDIPTQMGDVLATWSFGGKYRERNITADEERRRNRNASAAPGQPLSAFLDGDQSRNFDYLLGGNVDHGMADAYYDASKGNSPRRLPQSLSADYVASEKILAMFAMGKFEFGDTTLVAGARLESTDFNASSPTAIAPAANSYLKLFPSLTLRQAFTPSLIGRFALTRGINRPNFPEIVPRVLDATDGETARFEVGNTSLRPTISNNIDAGLEYYLRPVGILAVNAFYKDLTDYRYTVSRQGTFDGSPALLTRAENAPSGKLYGVEFNWQQQFTFLPGLLSGLGVFANYTFTQGDAKLSQAYGGRDVFPLQGQSKHMWNAALFYERGPVNLRVSYTKRSKYLNLIDANNADLDLYWAGRGQLDATASLTILKGLTMFVEGKNLTNSPGIRFYSDSRRVYEYEKFGYSFFGGLRFKL